MARMNVCARRWSIPGSSVFGSKHLPAAMKLTRRKCSSRCAGFARLENSDDVSSTPKNCHQWTKSVDKECRGDFRIHSALAFESRRLRGSLYYKNSSLGTFVRLTDQFFHLFSDRC